ncbi:UNKNOWN [Stylonychia lemnae]|uniref:Uncharacterized protein n=1 Tax=Stylonychia lemnae TaxID=5949 RepID=A0A078ALB1_STYLE|nr:UNKNOWN [Stylonychia lemnae]|eukprot:CDW83150.1 UNKNOWN [Stylonychia lemnae]
MNHQQYYQQMPPSYSNNNNMDNPQISYNPQQQQQTQIKIQGHPPPMQMQQQQQQINQQAQPMINYQTQMNQQQAVYQSNSIQVQKKTPQQQQVPQAQYSIQPQANIKRQSQQKVSSGTIYNSVSINQNGNHSNQSQKNDVEKQNLIGIQAQNLYLLNYINKLEFLVQESIKDRKQEKKKREKQINQILKALSDKPQLSKDIPTLSYYLGMTIGSDDKILDKIRDSDAEEENDSDAHDSLSKRLFAKNPLEDQVNRDEALGQESNEDKKPLIDLKMELIKKELPYLEKNYDKKKFQIDINDSTCLEAVDRSKDLIKKEKESQENNTVGSGSNIGKRSQRDKDEKEDSLDEYQISDFMKNEWKYLSKISSKLK